jgi:hypothetical protein
MEHRFSMCTKQCRHSSDLGCSSTSYKPGRAGRPPISAVAFESVGARDLSNARATQAVLLICGCSLQLSPSAASAKSSAQLLPWTVVRTAQSLISNSQPPLSFAPSVRNSRIDETKRVDGGSKRVVAEAGACATEGHRDKATKARHWAGPSVALLLIPCALVERTPGGRSPILI